MDAGLKVRVGRVGSYRAGKSREEIDVFLLSMKNKNPNCDQQRVDGESGHSSRSPKTRRESGRKDESTFAAVEIDSQSSSQHDAEQGDHPNENAEHTGLERGTNGNFPIQRVCGHGQARVKRGKPRLYRNFSRRFSIRDRNLDMDLGSAALRTKRPAVLDRGPALLARVLHVLEASAQRAGRARHQEIDAVSDCVVRARVHAHVDQGKAGPVAAGFNGNDMLVSLGSHFQLHRV